MRVRVSRFSSLQRACRDTFYDQDLWPPLVGRSLRPSSRRISLSPTKGRTIVANKGPLGPYLVGPLPPSRHLPRMRTFAYSVRLCQRPKNILAASVVDIPYSQKYSAFHSKFVIGENGSRVLELERQLYFNSGNYAILVLDDRRGPTPAWRVCCTRQTQAE